MSRSYTIRALTDEKGNPLAEVWVRAFNATTSALIETKYTDAAGVCTFTALPDNANVNICAIWGKNVKWVYGIFTAGQDVMYHSITADYISLTLDDIANGASYGRLLLTEISAGHIKLTSAAVFDGKWYSQAGVSISATAGINIWGTANALTTRATEAGAIQCYVGADGAIYAGAGAILLNATGLIVRGEKIFFYSVGGTLRGGVYGSSALEIQAVGAGVPITLTALGRIDLISNDHVRVTANVLPNATRTYTLGSAALRWLQMHGNPVLNSTDAAVEGGLSSSGGADGRLYVYASGTWRLNNVG